jgi:hypothetical protein
VQRCPQSVNHDKKACRARAGLWRNTSRFPIFEKPQRKGAMAQRAIGLPRRCSPSLSFFAPPRPGVSVVSVSWQEQAMPLTRLNRSATLFTSPAPDPPGSASASLRCGSRRVSRMNTGSRQPLEVVAASRRLLCRGPADFRNPSGRARTPFAIPKPVPAVKPVMPGWSPAVPGTTLHLSCGSRWVPQMNTGSRRRARSGSGVLPLALPGACRHARHAGGSPGAATR